MTLQEARKITLWGGLFGIEELYFWDQDWRTQNSLALKMLQTPLTFLLLSQNP